MSKCLEEWKLDDIVTWVFLLLLNVSYEYLDGARENVWVSVCINFGVSSSKIKRKENRKVSNC